MRKGVVGWMEGQSRAGEHQAGTGAISLNRAAAPAAPVAHDRLLLAAVARYVQVLDAPQRAVVPQRLARRRKPVLPLACHRSCWWVAGMLQ